MNAGADALLHFFVLLSKGLGLLLQQLNLIRIEPGAALNGHRSLHTRTGVASSAMADSVRIYVESNLNLGNAPRSRRNAGELKLCQRLVVLGEVAFPLEHV